MKIKPFQTSLPRSFHTPSAPRLSTAPLKSTSRVVHRPTQSVLDTARVYIESHVPNGYCYAHGKWVGPAINLQVNGKSVPFTPAIFLQNYRGLAVHLRVTLVGAEKIAWPVDQALYAQVQRFKGPHFADFNLDMSTPGLFFATRLMPRSLKSIASILQKTVAAIEGLRA